MRFYDLEGIVVLAAARDGEGSIGISLEVSLNKCSEG